MSWARRFRLALCAAAFVVPGLAEAALVVASSGPSAGQFPVGKKIDDNESITLRDGDSVTVLVKGGTRVLRGAGTISVNQPGGTPAVSTFAALVRPRGATRVRTGAVRGAAPGGRIMSPNLWYVDVDKSGTVCILDPAEIRLWRADRERPATYRIVATDGASATASFSVGDMVSPWDAEALPVTEGATFSIVQDDGRSNKVTFALLAEEPDNPEAMASTLIEKGCTAQLDLLTASLKIAEGPTN